MSEDLRRSTGTPGTIVNITRHAAELERLLNEPGSVIIATDPTVEDAATFALGKHLEDFLVANWASTDLGRGYRIYEVDGERVGQQFPTDTGPIDVLAISHDGTELLVVELKRGRASDSVVGQIQRYMGYVAQDLAEPTQRVRGAIIALEDDLRVRRALAVAPTSTSTGTRSSSTCTGCDPTGRPDAPPDLRAPAAAQGPPGPAPAS